MRTYSRAEKHAIAVTEAVLLQTRPLVRLPHYQQKQGGEVSEPQRTPPGQTSLSTQSTLAVCNQKAQHGPS